MLTFLSYIATGLVSAALGAGGLYLWAVLLDPSAPGDGLEKRNDL